MAIGAYHEHCLYPPTSHLSLFICRRCNDGAHVMTITDTSRGRYSSGWVCDGCGVRGAGRRWCCERCEDDYCLDCRPEFNSDNNGNNGHNNSSSSDGVTEAVRRWVATGDHRAEETGDGPPLCERGWHTMVRSRFAGGDYGDIGYTASRIILLCADTLCLVMIYSTRLGLQQVLCTG